MTLLKKYTFSFRNDCLELSPLNILNKFDFSLKTNSIKVFVVYAEHDSPAFHNQSSQFAKVCKNNFSIYTFHNYNYFYFRFI
jgi:hypothetical protein